MARVRVTGRLRPAGTGSGYILGRVNRLREGRHRGLAPRQHGGRLLPPLIGEEVTRLDLRQQRDSFSRSCSLSSISAKVYCPALPSLPISCRRALQRSANSSYSRPRSDRKRATIASSPSGAEAEVGTLSTNPIPPCWRSPSRKLLQQLRVRSRPAPAPLAFWPRGPHCLIRSHLNATRVSIQVTTKIQGNTYYKSQVRAFFHNNILRKAQES